MVWYNIIHIYVFVGSEMWFEWQKTMRHGCAGWKGTCKVNAGTSSAPCWRNNGYKHQWECRRHSRGLCTTSSESTYSQWKAMTHCTENTSYNNTIYYICLITLKKKKNSFKGTLVVLAFWMLYENVEFSFS